jgi:hypothetical protein
VIEIKYKIISHKNIEKHELKAIFLKKIGPGNDVLPLAIYRGIDSE